MSAVLTLSADALRSEAQTMGREWLVTNGLGGFAAGSLAGANTRRYHGLLIAALRPPLERTVMVAKLDAVVLAHGVRHALTQNEFADGTIAPVDVVAIDSFRLEGLTPVWSWRIGDALLEQRVWMQHGANTTYVQYTLVQGASTVKLELSPLCTYRDYHSHHRGERATLVTALANGVQIDAFWGARPYRVLAERGEHRIAPQWWWRFRHREESARGLDDVEDLFRPAVFEMTLAPGESGALVMTAEDAAPAGAVESLARERARQTQVVGEKMDPRVRGDDEGRRLRTREDGVGRAGEDGGLRSREDGVWPAREVGVSRKGEGATAAFSVTPADAGAHLRSRSDHETFLHRLALAADQFIVERRAAEPTEGRHTVIAGYPWFGDWGRDTMIALPGLTLTTHRFDIAASVLRTFAAHVSDGMLPNRFPDAGEAPEYNTVDATLWFFIALDEYVRASGDRTLAEDLYPTLRSIIRWHQRGTRYGVRVDPHDGLLRAGEPGVQLTWMDAKIGDWVVTPRIGKPVEINALWVNALTIMRDLSASLKDADAAREYAAAAERAARSFGERFWFERGGYLYDVVDSSDGDDASLRPNQIFAVSLRHALLDNGRAKAVVDVCARELWTPVGLRSLAPGDSRYAGRYVGGPHKRDAVYHQGTVWSWLLGPFVSAHYRVYGDAATALSYLNGVAAHLQDACIGQISEIFDGDAPHAPRGCVAQAWSVAEILRASSEIHESEAAHRRETRTAPAQV